jgi:transcriptional regulator with XRE-family HTH domain
MEGVKPKYKAMAKDIRIQFSHRLRKLRTEAGMTQEELARKSGISVKYIQNLESDDPKNPTLLILDKLAKGIGVSRAVLLTF